MVLLRCYFIMLHYKTDLFKSLFKDQKLSQLLLTLVAACMQMSEKTRQDAV